MIICHQIGSIVCLVCSSDLLPRGQKCVSLCFVHVIALLPFDQSYQSLGVVGSEPPSQKRTIDQRETIKTRPT